MSTKVTTHTQNIYRSYTKEKGVKSYQHKKYKGRQQERKDQKTTRPAENNKNDNSSSFHINHYFKCKQIKPPNQSI